MRGRVAPGQDLSACTVVRARRAEDHRTVANSTRARPTGDSGVEIDSIFERLYRRPGVHYLDLFHALQSALVVLLMIPAFGGLLVAVLGISFEEWLRCTVAFELTLGVFGSAAIFIVPRRRWPAVMRWIGGDHDPGIVSEVWSTVLTDAPRIVVRILGCFALIAVVPSAYVSHDLSFAWYGYATFYLTVMVVTLMVAVFAYLLFEQALRPVVREVAVTLPVGVETSQPTVSLAAKLLVMVSAINFCTAVLVGALARTSADGELYLGYVIGLAVLVSATVSLVLTLMLRHSMLQRVNELRAAMRRVDGGELDIYVPSLAGDELDDLGSSFNEMVRGLREREALRDDNRALASSLQDSRARIVVAAHRERRRMERDLHDGAQQHLVMLGLQAGQAQRQLERDPVAAAATLEELRRGLTRAMAELRDLAHGIYPTLLEDDGLGAALHDSASRAAIPTTVSDETSSRFGAEIEAAVYFCCLEALQNAGKHAGEAATAVVTLSERAGELAFEVADDGRGFPGTDDVAGAGLQNMRDRIGALGGRLSVRSAPGAGTTISGSIPLSDGAT